MAITADILRSKFGFNDPNVIEGILRDPGQVARYERELNPPPPQIDSAAFATDQTAARNALNQQSREEEQAFLTRFRTDYPNIISGVEGSLGLPGLRETAFQSTQAFKALPEDIATASLGKDVSANQLRRMTSSRQSETLPELNDLLAFVQFQEEEAGRQSERALVPYQTEVDFLKDRFARESTGFGQDAQRELDLAITKIQSGTQLSIAEMNRATQLAQMEADKEQYKSTFDTVDLGNRVAIVDLNGNVLRYENKGKLSTLSGSGNDPLNLL